MKAKKNNFCNTRYSGFTLIELLVVIAIIALLASVILASLRSAKERAYDAQIKSDMAQVRNALELYAGSNGYIYPLNAKADDVIYFAERTNSSMKNHGSTLFIKLVVRSLKDLLGTIAYAQSRDYGCVYFDNLESVLVPNFIGEMPKHPLDDGEGVCYKYFALTDGTVATAYAPLVTERYTNGTNKQIGVVVGKTDVDSLRTICAESKGLENTPFPMFAASGGGDICVGSSVVDTIIGVTNGEGDLSSDSYI